jgi:hypothetical protein
MMGVSSAGPASTPVRTMTPAEINDYVANPGKMPDCQNHIPIRSSVDIDMLVFLTWWFLGEEIMG